MLSKRYSIIVTDPTGVVRRLSVPVVPALILVACILTFPVLMGLGARWSAHITIAELERENAALIMENASYKEATGQLATQISSLQTAVEELGVRAAVDPQVSRAMDKLPAIVKSRAMGGGAAESALLRGLFRSPDSTFGVIRDLLGVLEGRLNSVRGGVERHEALAAATPSMWPVPGWLSSSFGNRTDPFTGEADFHPGLDISANSGDPVHATADGTIQSAAYNGSYGNLVVIDHGYGITTRYGHLSRFNVTQGQQVRRGDVIGFVGSTGRSTSSHLHYEVLVNGKLTNPMKLLSGLKP